MRQVLVAEEVVRYAVRLADSSRPGRGAKLDFIEKWVKWGAGLRASHALVIGAKARALLHGRHHVSVKDIQALAKPILRHRVLPNFYAEAEGITVGSHRRSAARRGPAARQRVVDDPQTIYPMRLASRPDKPLHLRACRSTYVLMMGLAGLPVWMGPFIFRAPGAPPFIALGVVMLGVAFLWVHAFEVLLTSDSISYRTLWRGTRTFRLSDIERAAVETGERKKAFARVR